MTQLPPVQQFQPCISPGERVLWSGRPKQGLALSGKDALLIPFSLLWGGFAIFWNAIVWMGPSGGDVHQQPDWFFKLWGLPFLVIGIYLIVGRFIHDASIRKNLFYAVTNQRVLTLRGSKLTSVDLDRLPRLDLSEGHDGTGTLSFEANSPFGMSGMNGLSWWLSSVAGGAQFFRIKEPRKVYELIRNQSRT